MRKKISVLIVMLLMCLSSILIMPDDLKVEASGEGSGGGDDTGLDYDFVWNVTKLLCNVTFDAYENEPFSRGRGWATKGENYTIEKILIPYMEGIELDDYCNLTGVRTLPLGHLDDFDDHYYTSKVEAIDFNLTINNASNASYPFENPVPKTEIFPFTSARRCCLSPYNLNGKYLFNETRIVKSASDVWPFAGTLNPNYHCNLSGDLMNNYCVIVGNATYVSSVDDLPDDQEDRVFIMNESDGCEYILDNLTNATGSILIHNNSRGYPPLNATKYDFSMARINDTDDNFSEIQSRLKSGEAMLVDNVVNDSLLTFTYNLSDGSWPDSGGHWVLIVDIPTPENDSNIWEWWGEHISTKSLVLFGLNKLPFPIYALNKCLGFIVHDYNNDTHIMGPVSRTWKYRYDYLNQGWGLKAFPFPSLPVFSINGTVGGWLEDNRSGTTISGYMEQKYRNEVNGTGVNSSNVVGYRNISKSPNDSIVIISSRFDGFWGPTPGDSGVGNAIILGIAKYFNDYNITPKYNLTFLLTTGEEYGMRGAYHYRDSHPGENYNITLWIGTDMLAWDQNDSFLEPQISDQNSDKTNYSIVWQIVNDTNYNQTGYDCIPSVLEKGKDSGAEDAVWIERCTTICFGKDAVSELTRYHRAGMNYTEGDVLKYIDRNDTNVTFEVVWNVIKYFTVNPNCWFENDYITWFDSPDDGDYLNDSIRINFTIKTGIPHDLTMVNASLGESGASDNEKVDYTVTSDGLNGSITLTYPENGTVGSHGYSSHLYNSTGRINEIVGIDGNNYDDSGPAGLVYLYPYNFDKFPSEITDVSDTPINVGFGFNVTISADVTDNASIIDTVKVDIESPNVTLDVSWNFTMTNTGGDTYEYVFSDTWLVGQYNYTIWTLDNSSNINSSSGHSFNVSAQANISVCTIKNSYGNNETVNLTDPPGVDPPLIGYELLDNNSVLHMWNEYNSYYFNTSSGIQLTNHYGEYWSHNVMMLGYYDNDEWNLIYRTDELSDFTKNVSTDNETFVNATLWKDLTYGGYDFRLAVRYHLGVNDSDLTVIPHIKNLGDAIPYNLGFGWEIKDIKIADTYENDWIRLYNGTDWISYSLNQTLNNTYADMDYNTTFYLEGRNEGKYFRRTLYLGWNHTLDYLLKVKSRTGQYNAPVTLFIKVGTLSQNQEKYTEMHWLDSDDWLGVGSSEVATACEFKQDLEMALDGIGMWGPSDDHDHEFILDLGQKYSIKKFRGRSESTFDPTDVDIYISTDNSTWGTAVASDISTWQDTSTWVEVNSADKDGQYIKVVVQATEDANRRLAWGLTPPGTIFDVYGDVVPTPPEISNPYPADGSTGISLTPTLNITVSDAGGDTMNITWSSNSSGSWQVFGTNNSVGNGTYRQTFSNATENGQWWYWKVNVSDGTSYNESSVYKFYTGYQSKIKNAGSTSIKGYLLIQVQYYNTSTSAWVVADDTINETTPRTIHSSETNSSDQLALDTVFNRRVNTLILESFGNGTYRIYVAFRDSNGNVLICDDETELVATYEFTITFD